MYSSRPRRYCFRVCVYKNTIVCVCVCVCVCVRVCVNSPLTIQSNTSFFLFKSLCLVPSHRTLQYHLCGVREMLRAFFFGSQKKIALYSDSISYTHTHTHTSSLSHSLTHSHSHAHTLTQSVAGRQRADAQLWDTDANVSVAGLIYLYIITFIHKQLRTIVYSSVYNKNKV